MDIPVPANSRRWAAWGAVAVLAAAVMLAVLFQNGIGSSPSAVGPTVAENDDPFVVGEPEIPVRTLDDDLKFASSEEVVVHDLQYGENVQVMQVDGDEGAVILWVDEEAWL